jgi:hypothetical protein
VVIISSIGGLRGSTVIGAYGISKAADFRAVPQPRRRMGPEGRPGQLRAPAWSKTISPAFAVGRETRQLKRPPPPAPHFAASANPTKSQER